MDLVEIVDTGGSTATDPGNNWVNSYLPPFTSSTADNNDSEDIIASV